MILTLSDTRSRYSQLFTTNYCWMIIVTKFGTQSRIFFMRIKFFKFQMNGRRATARHPVLWRINIHPWYEGCVNDTVMSVTVCPMIHSP